jgi:eukaryotic-like serine/threonine-protein kinase
VSSHHARPSELLLRWEESRDQGHLIDVEELCRDCPELLAELKSRIRALDAMDPILVTGPDSSARPGSGPPSELLSVKGAVVKDNYELLDELGHGGMGVVYRARDRARGEIVALKILKPRGHSALTRFKHEFRALADVVHPNLVRLYELISDGWDWFFTMELIDGTDILKHVRPKDDVAELDHDGAPSSSSPSVEIQAGAECLPYSSLSECQVDRLRDSLGQLARGVVALHEAGRLHRDIKPTNVMVERGGRVVLMDFGLVAELEDTGHYQSTDPHILGTAVYMAPEQAAAGPVSMASDWYSVGALLYEALTGRPPFVGRPLELLTKKQTVDSPAPHDVVVGVPADLDALCVELLSRDPVLRPDGREVLRRLGNEPGGSGAPTSVRMPRACHMLIGRERHLQALSAAFDSVTQGRTVTLYAHGPSGVGKSALIQHFLDDLVQREKVVVLTGRCYERESVPYKAFDSLVDGLGQYLARLPQHEAQELMPRDVSSLRRIFPVLQRVPAVAAAPRRDLDVPDLQELRRRAFAALRELLARLGDRKRLVLFIDDLQWGDIDSAALLAELMRPPDPPVLMLLGCYRSEDDETSPFLQSLLTATQSTRAAGERRELAVEPLTRLEAETLALELLNDGDPSLRAWAGDVARESEGNPFFVQVLVKSLQSAPESTGCSAPTDGITLDQVLWARVLRLPDPSRRLLEIIAVSGGPLGLIEASHAAELGRDERSALEDLHEGRLIRVRSTDPVRLREIETYHDRVREAIANHLPAASLEGHHRRLAIALEASPAADPEVLAVHFRGANELAKSRLYYARAADSAVETLAFDRAAMLYRRALELRPTDDVQALRKKLADALANAGRGSEAARAYLDAASIATDDAALELRRRAAEQFLISGHVDDGLATLQVVLTKVGMRLPGSPWGALLSLQLRGAVLRLRGLGFRPVDAEQIPQDDLTRIDICWSVAVGLSLVDIVRGADYQRRGLLLSLRAGDPFRIARSLAFESAQVSIAGKSSGRRTTRLLEAAENLSGSVNKPYVFGLLWAVKGIQAFLYGSWKKSHELSEKALKTFREQCTGVAWELDSMHNFTLWSLTYMGEVAELSKRRPALIKEAQDRGDHYAMTNLSTSHTMAVVRLGADDPEGARVELKAIDQWTQKGFHIQHHIALLARVLIDLYLGEGLAAWSYVSKKWPAYTDSLLFRVQQIHIDALQLRGRSALAAAMTASDPAPFWRDAEAAARRLERKNAPWAAAHAEFLRAGVAAGRGDLSSAVALLTAASRGFDATDMRLYAMVTRRRLGELLGGDEGRVLVQKADSWMTDQTIRNPARMTAMYAPGFPD